MFAIPIAFLSYTILEISKNMSIVMLIAGVVLVVLLYCLNLTVTKGTINGIIFYANIISINGFVFLVNDNVYKPLKVFISLIWVLQHVSIMEWTLINMVTPFYLTVIAILLIITS